MMMGRRVINRENKKIYQIIFKKIKVIGNITITPRIISFVSKIFDLSAKLNHIIAYYIT